jgi:hypothetical protein
MVLGFQCCFQSSFALVAKLKKCRNLRGSFTLFLNFDGSEVVHSNPVVVVLFVGFLI